MRARNGLIFDPFTDLYPSLCFSLLFSLVMRFEPFPRYQNALRMADTIQRVWPLNQLELAQGTEDALRMQCAALIKSPILERFHAAAAQTLSRLFAQLSQRTLDYGRLTENGCSKANPFKQSTCAIACTKLAAESFFLASQRWLDAKIPSEGEQIDVHSLTRISVSRSQLCLFLIGICNRRRSFSFLVPQNCFDNHTRATSNKTCCLGRRCGRRHIVLFIQAGGQASKRPF